MSAVSIAAISGTFSSIRSPRRRIRRARSFIGRLAHFGNAALAASTAWLISASPPEATSASTSPVAGLVVWK
ncbi:hypothetical protein D3C76_1789870 [compost metagenome]